MQIRIILDPEVVKILIIDPEVPAVIGTVSSRLANVEILHRLHQITITDPLKGNNLENPRNNIPRRNYYNNNYNQTRNQNTPYDRYQQERSSQSQNAGKTGARPRSNSSYNNQPNQHTKRNIDCYACGKRGHYARECSPNINNNR